MELSKLKRNFTPMSTRKWIDITDDVSVLLSYFSSASMEYKKYTFKQGRAKIARMRNAGAQELSDDTLKTFVNLSVHDWKGITIDGTSKPYPFSKEACISLFRDAPEFFEACMMSATDRFLFEQEDPEEVAKK